MQVKQCCLVVVCMNRCTVQPPLLQCAIVCSACTKPEHSPCVKHQTDFVFALSVQVDGPCYACKLRNFKRLKLLLCGLIMVLDPAKGLVYSLHCIQMCSS